MAIAFFSKLQTRVDQAIGQHAQPAIIAERYAYASDTTLSKNPLIPLCHLLQAIARQDESALSALYDATLPKLYGLALKITRRHDLAEETVEDTYLQVWQEASRYTEARGSVLAWLATICRTRAIDALRRLDKAELSAAPETLDTQATFGDDSLDLLLIMERDSRLYAAMRALTPLQRQLICLSFFKDYSHEQIARQMQLPLGTVKSTIKRAQVQLKQALTIKENNHD